MAEAKKDKKFLELESQIAELTEALQHERADSINLRRQSENALASVRTQAVVRVVGELLPAIDNLERALKHVPKDLSDNDYVKGVSAVVKQFEKSLSDIGVERIKTVGEPFDPNLHEAVHMDDSSEGSNEVVSEELQSGYIYNGEVIRHAMVKVRLT